MPTCSYGKKQRLLTADATALCPSFKQVASSEKLSRLDIHDFRSQSQRFRIAVEQPKQHQSNMCRASGIQRSTNKQRC
jgi:hypothetical protein